MESYMHKVQARSLQQGITMVCMQQRGRGRGDVVIYRRGVRGQMCTEGETGLPTRLWYQSRKISGVGEFKRSEIRERLIIESIRTKVRYAKEREVCLCVRAKSERWIGERRGERSQE